MEENQETTNQTLSNKISNKLLDNRTLFIYGEVDQELAEKVSAQLLVLESINTDPITIYINSQGGHVESGDTIHDMITYITSPVRVVGTGWVASAGVTIYLAAKKENRFALPNTRFMIHQPLGGVHGPASDIAIESQELVKIRQRVNTMISDATGQPLEKVEIDTLRNYWLDGSEAVEYGIAHKVITHITELV